MFVFSEYQIRKVGLNIYRKRFAVKYIKRIEEQYSEMREYEFTHKNRPSHIITIKVSPDGFIQEIENEFNLRFPFSVGQRFSRNFEVWACNNNFFMNGEDTCPEEKIFGIKKSDIPMGHELRMMYPHKFKK